MALIDDYTTLDGVALTERLEQKKIGLQDIFDSAKHHIERLNPSLNAVVEPFFEQIEPYLNENTPKGPLYGVPMLIKDSISYKGVAASFGSRFFSDNIANHDSELITRYKKAGVLILGRSNMPEFGLKFITEPAFYGATKNPWNEHITTGGSSGGAASMVASRAVPVAHGSDGGGSLRVPASCCGIFTLKPTRGRVSFAPDLGESWGGLVAQHVLSISVRDSALFLDVESKPIVQGEPYYAPDEKRAFAKACHTPLSSLKIGVVTQLPTDISVDEDCLKAVEHATEIVRALGHMVEPVDLHYHHDTLSQAILTIASTGSAYAIDSYAALKKKTLQPVDLENITFQLYEKGKATTGSVYLHALESMHRECRKLVNSFSHFDVLLTPTLAKSPIALGSLTDNQDIASFHQSMQSFSPFTALFNQTGQPAMNVPLYWNEDHIPIGVQFVGKTGDEFTLLQLAFALEKTCPWADKRPPLNALNPS